MEYKIVKSISTIESEALRELETNVNQLIQKGWEPIGGIHVNKDAGWFFCLQAMIRKPR